MQHIDQKMPHPVDLHVGRRVAERRISLGLSQSDLAKALGLSFQQVQKYEKGTNRISASKLWTTSALMGVEIDYFFLGLSRTTGTWPPPEDADLDVVSSPTRCTVEIARLAPRLTPSQQKVVVTIMRELIEASRSPA